VETYKYLGVLIDSNISWKAHIDKLCNMLRFAVLCMFKLKSIANVKLLKMIYYSYFQSHIQYCLSVYGSAFPSVLNRLHVLQRKIIRLIGSCVGNANSSLALFKEFDILPFSALYYYRCFCYIKKHFCDYIQSMSFNSRNLSYSNNFLFKTTRAQSTLKFRKVALLNSLKTDLLVIN